jgi:hypothetical protein
MRRIAGSINGNEANRNTFERSAAFCIAPQSRALRKHGSEEKRCPEEAGGKRPRSGTIFCPIHG